MDVTKQDHVDNAINKIIAEQGRIDVLVNNAGIAVGSAIEDVSMEDALYQFEVNLFGIGRTVKAALPHMRAQGSGTIINISSVSGLMGNPGQVNYASSKAALSGFTKSLAKEVGSRNITVNSVAPGYIDTDMTSFLDADAKEKILNNIPLGRIGIASDVSELVMFLASDEASYITGQTISVDGGLLMY